MCCHIHNKKRSVCTVCMCCHIHNKKRSVCTMVHVLSYTKPKEKCVCYGACAVIYTTKREVCVYSGECVVIYTTKIVCGYSGPCVVIYATKREVCGTIVLVLSYTQPKGCVCVLWSMCFQYMQKNRNVLYHGACVII